MRFKQGASSSDRAAAKQDAGASLERKLLLSRTELVEVTPGEEKEAAAKLERDPNVLYAEPNAIVHEDATPNDTRFTDLWGLNNTGQQVDGVAGLADADIDAPEAWNLGAGLGSSVRVAVVDSGVVANHPDLAANMFINPGESGGGKETNGIDDDGNGKIDDFRGWDFAYNDNNPTTNRDHGTHVAGTIAARSNNGLGVAGAASFPTPAGSWLGPKILAVKVLNEQGSGTIASLADGLVYAGTMNAKVANVSLGFAGTSATLDNAIKSRPNTLYVVAAGNDGVNNDTSPHTPCNPATAPDAANKICVAATDSSDALAGFSNFGAVNVDLAAPGVSILSTVPTQDRLQRQLRDADRGPLDDHRRRADRDAALGAHHAVLDQPLQQPHRLAGGQLREQPGQLGAQHDRLQPHRGQPLQGHRPGEDRHRGQLRHVHHRGHPDPGGRRELADGVRLQRSRNRLGDRQPPRRLRRADRRLRPLPPQSDGSNQDDGAYVDDVAVKCRTNAFNATSYGFLNGTSMATPHVAGAAAFLFTKFPAATVAEVKNKILRSADRKASLTGRVLTGARLNLYKAAAESTAAVSGGVLRFTAGAGQRNNVTATRFVDSGVPKYRITDPYSTSTTTQQSGSRINRARAAPASTTPPSSARSQASPASS